MLSLRYFGSARQTGPAWRERVEREGQDAGRLPEELKSQLDSRTRKN